MACPALPLISTPVPVPGFPPNPTSILPFVGHVQGGGGCTGTFGSDCGGGLLADDDERDVEPDGGDKRITWPGWISDPSPKPFQRATSAGSLP